jgi:uncharacterized phosphatase
MSSTFFLLRHGLTADDMPGREKVTGWLEVGLNQAGRKNAQRAAQFLKNKNITSITTSDLKRAEQTAEIVGRELGLPLIRSEKLRSWNMGAIQGMLATAAKPFLTFFQENPEVTPPKAEKFDRFYHRFKGVWIATCAYVKKFPNAHPLLVTHSQDLDIIEWFLDDIEPGQALEFGQGIAPCGVLEVRINDEGEISLRKLKV